MWGTVSLDCGQGVISGGNQPGSLSVQMLADAMCVTKEQREDGLRGSNAGSLRHGELSCEIPAQAWMKSCLAGLLCC